MYVKRDTEKLFDKVAKVYKVVAIVGARQSGKTTLLRKKLEEYGGSYVSFDDPDVREMFNTDVKKFEKQYVAGNKFTGLDEVQYGTDAGRKIKYLADKGHRLWITSSSEIILGKDVLSYLVGRVSILRLFPFSLNEFLRARRIKEVTEGIKERLIWEHAVYGGYPKAVLTEETDLKRIILRDLIETMVLKDVSRTFSIENVESLEKLVKYLAVNTGSVVSYESITSALNISFQSVKKYLNAMEKSYIIKMVVPFYTNKTKELTKRPKVYFIDTGLMNTITGNRGELSGRVFENYIFTELLKKGLEIKYWRTKTGAEVDFVVNSVPVEVKLTSPKISRGLRSFIRKYRPERAFVVFYRGKEKEVKVNGCQIIFTDVFGVREGL